MLLKQKEINSELFNTDIMLEKVASDLIMISIKNEIQYSDILSYWRLTDVLGIPPLEMGIDCEQGYIASVTFFVDDFIPLKEEMVNFCSSKGNALIDTEPFQKVNEYLDVFQRYKIFFGDNKLVCLFTELEDIDYSIKNNQFEIFIDSKAQIVGFSLCDLSKEEVEMIMSIKG